jgi:hypothetical protein
MSKIKEFLTQKIANFKLFIAEQFEILKLNKVEIKEENITLLLKDLEHFEKDVNSFVQKMSYLQNRNIDDSIKAFLIIYDISIDQIREFINYKKLKQYICMFLDVMEL